MSYYSQNLEDKFILDLFENEISKHYGIGFTGNILELGSNSGDIISNSLAFIERKWKAVLVEPSPSAFEKLVSKHENNEAVICYNVAISDYDGESEFYDSGTHFRNGDVALLSTLNEHETERWGSSTTFNKIRVPVWSVNTLLVTSPIKVFDVVSIDCEGEDLKILKQINFFKIKTCVVCVEWNGEDFDEYDSCLKKFDFKLVHQNAENLIYYRQHRKMK